MFTSQKPAASERSSVSPWHFFLSKSMSVMCAGILLSMSAYAIVVPTDPAPIIVIFVEFIYSYFFTNQGINTLVLFLYSSNSGRCCNCFSAIGTPETNVKSIVIVMGDIIAASPNGEDRAISHNPHHIRHSPK